MCDSNSKFPLFSPEMLLMTGLGKYGKTGTDENGKDIYGIVPNYPNPADKESVIEVNKKFLEGLSNNNNNNDSKKDSLDQYIAIIQKLIQKQNKLDRHIMTLYDRLEKVNPLQGKDLEDHLYRIGVYEAGLKPDNPKNVWSKEIYDNNKNWEKQQKQQRDLEWQQEQQQKKHQVAEQSIRDIYKSGSIWKTMSGLPNTILTNTSAIAGGSLVSYDNGSWSPIPPPPPPTNKPVYILYWFTHIAAFNTPNQTGIINIYNNIAQAIEDYHLIKKKFSNIEIFISKLDSLDNKSINMDKFELPGAYI